jgi:hypothetical protein
MVVFVAFCIAMMSLMMRRHSMPAGPRAFGPGGVSGFGAGFGPWRGFASTGASRPNEAFEAYREETFRRLEQEQAEFRKFLEQLRLAKDKAEFDQFIAERRGSATA